MSDIRIEKGIPMPKKGERVGGAKNILEQLEVGDSILVPIGKVEGFRVAARRSERKIVTSSQRDGTVRIWRAS